MNLLELFAGIGGLSLGLERAGMTVVGHVEIDPYARSILHKHWPEVPSHDDVRTALAWWRSEPRPSVDVIAGGYPCQPESLAGHGRSTADHRWLWPDMARIIHALRPRWIIGENVMGHRTRGLRFVLRDLERLGYTAAPGVISAREVGAPHLRKRLVTIARWPDVADPLGVAGGARRIGDAEQGPQRRTSDRGGSGGDVADIGRAGLEGPGELHDQGTVARQVATDGGWWAAEPDVGRVAHGVSHRVDRLRCLGNAVVPAVAEHLGHLVLAVDRELRHGT